ncbi:unnamed protein product [Anisakis simplex]|uniref:Pecanex-like protein n=1 Tax=Anisakis simplex TaxID=6269 RepID=A0A0M3J496_ANISI|nr:unnamed protein product [Anisakis simplex]
MVEALQTINVWVGRGAQMSSDESPLNPTPPYVPSDPFSEEMKAVQERWHEIDINNSWEMLLLQSPPSIKALGELMVLSLTPSNRSSVCIGEGISLRAPRYHLGGAGYLQTLLAQAAQDIFRL